jgi:hypothetical protein
MGMLYKLQVFLHIIMYEILVYFEVKSKMKVKKLQTIYILVLKIEK